MALPGFIGIAKNSGPVFLHDILNLKVTFEGYLEDVSYLPRSQTANLEKVNHKTIT
jgi:hypothetical protein